MNQNIILFDGECKFCRKCISFVNRNLKHKKILFYPFKSKEANNIMHDFKIETIDSVVFVTENNAYFKSKAVLEILKFLRFPFYYFSYFKILPNLLLDIIYDNIAKRRNICNSKKQCCNGK